jgi:methylmalonyl-CoA mutase cobalamin-binding subunit
MAVMSARRYPIRAAGRLTGLPLETLRAWERRYEAVVPERGPRGRLYTDAQIDRLRLLREAVEQGHAIGLVSRHDTAALRALVEHGRQPPPPAPPAAPWPVLAPVMAAIERLDAPAADAELGKLAALLAPRAFVFEVVLPLMRETGARWHRHEFSVAQEHLVSATLRHLLGALIRLHAPPGVAPTLVFATPAGELHEFGILAAAMLAASAGHGVLYLGPNLPTPDIVAAATGAGVRVVVLGLTAANHRNAAAHEIGLVAGRLPAPVELWVGGEQIKPPRRRGRVELLSDFAAFERALARLREGNGS